MIIAVSDTHIGARRTNTKCFDCFINHFLANEQVDDLILLGDIVDLWRENWETILPEIINRFNRLAELSNIKRIHFVKGNHDYKLREYLEDETKLQRMKENNSDLEIKFREKIQFSRGLSVDRTSDPRESEKILVLESGGRNFVFTHGYQWEAYMGFGINQYEELCRSYCDIGGNFFLKLGGYLYDIKDELVEKSPNEYITTVYDCIKTVDPNAEINEELIYASAQEFVTLTELREKAPITRDISPAHQELIRKQLYLQASPEIRQKGLTPLTSSENAFLEEYGTKSRSFSGLPQKRIPIPVGQEEADIGEVYVEPDEYLIYGHVHQPGCNPELSNTGSWTEDNDQGPLSNFLIINNGKITLRHWPPQQDAHWNFGTAFKELRCLQHNCDLFG